MVDWRTLVKRRPKNILLGPSSLSQEVLTKQKPCQDVYFYFPIPSGKPFRFSSPEPRSFWPAAGIESSGFVQHRKSTIHGFPVKSGKSDWLRIWNDYSAHAQKIGSGQISILPLSTVKVAQSSFQYFSRHRFWCVIITTRYHLMYNHGINKLPNHRWIRWYHFCDTIGYHSLLKTPLILALGAYISKTARWNFFLISNFDKQDKMQLFAKFKRILYMGFRATLYFRKCKVALNSKSCVLSCLWNTHNIKKFHRAVFEKALKAEIKGVFSRP